jgi:hypothetical protein
MIHPSTPQRYVTGQPALSVPVDAELSDWHLCSSWSDAVTPIPIAGDTYPSTAHLWGSTGVIEQSAYLIAAGVVTEGPVYVASPARALADMLYAVLAAQLDPSFLDADRTAMSPASHQQLVTLIRMLRECEPSAALQRWIDRQPRLVHALAASR